MSKQELKVSLSRLYESNKGHFCPKCQPALGAVFEGIALYQLRLIQAMPADAAAVAVGKMEVAAEKRDLVRQFASMAVAIRQTVDRKRAFLEERLAGATDADQREWFGLQLQELDYFDQTGRAIEAQLALMGFPLQFGDGGLDTASPQA